MREPTLREAEEIRKQKPKKVEGGKTLYYLKGIFPALLATRLLHLNGHKVEWTVPEIVDGKLVGLYFKTESEMHPNLVE